MHKTSPMRSVLFVALLTALYMVIYMIVMPIVVIGGPFFHAFSPGLAGLLTGPILIFMTRKVACPWQFSLMTLLVMGVFALMGGGYLPWLISSMVAAVIADLIASQTARPSIGRVAVASALLHMGQACGAIIPSWFFVESYRENWIQRGQTAADMDAMIHYTVGWWGALALVIVAVLSVIGVVIGYRILRHHLGEVSRADD